MSESSRSGALRAALLRRSPLWQTAGERARRLARAPASNPADAVDLAAEYRLLAHDVARARELIPNMRALAFLESAYAGAHATLYKPARHPGRAALVLVRDDLPATVRWLSPHILWSTVLFALMTIAGYALVHAYPRLIALFAAPDLIASVEHGRLWTDSLLNIVPSSVLSLQILTNNIVVSLFAYCAGFLFGLGTFYILGINGLMLGAVFAFTELHGLAGALFKFVVAHGCVEISVMCLSGAAGAAVGEALIRPETAERAESFRRAALRSGVLIVACVVLLVGAGLIEGYVSPRTDVPLAMRVAIGVGYWVLMVALLSGWLIPGGRAAVARTRSTPRLPERHRR